MSRNNLNINDFTIKQLFRCCCGKTFELYVEGTSMFPVLHTGQKIKICAKDNYSIGDILVFFYKNNVILVHRLLKIENNLYFCKGDNSFRIEDIEKNDIVGAVIIDNDVNNSPDFIQASISINQIFRKCGYNSDLVKQSIEYKEYASKYLEIR